MAATEGSTVPDQDSHRVVVAGAGLAGLGTVTALRERGFTGEIVLLGAEALPPYDRPPLSKAVLLDGSDTAPPDTALPFDVDALAVDVRLETQAVGWRPGTVKTDRGDLDYDTLVVATGAEPIRLPGPGGQYLRTRADALRLRAALRPGARVVIVGAGWIGAEVATAAARRGAHVTVVEQAPTPVAHALPEEVAAWMIPWYAEAGVELARETRVGAVEPDGVVLADGEADGERLPADVVVVGVGVRPACGWLSGTSVELDRGVVVDPALRAAGADHVWAVGDVVARWSPRYGTRIRGEHWDDALRSPAVAAAGILGDPQVYDPVPYVWSEQFGRMVQYAGRYENATTTVWRADPATGRAWSVIWLDADDRVVAVLAVSKPKDFVQARRLAESGRVVDPSLVGDPEVAVKAAVAA